jgi:hypothetical protein
MSRREARMDLLVGKRTTLLNFLGAREPEDIAIANMGLTH